MIFTKTLHIAEDDTSSYELDRPLPKGKKMDLFLKSYCINER